MHVKVYTAKLRYVYVHMHALYIIMCVAMKLSECSNICTSPVILWLGSLGYIVGVW